MTVVHRVLGWGGKTAMLRSQAAHLAVMSRPDAFVTIQPCLNGG
jgi:hypothetical protein